MATICLKLNCIYAKMLPMEEKFYTVIKIDGEYAYLLEIGKCEESDVFIALYLLPQGVNIGTKIKSAFFEYEIID